MIRNVFKRCWIKAPKNSSIRYWLLVGIFKFTCNVVWRDLFGALMFLSEILSSRKRRNHNNVTFAFPTMGGGTQCSLRSKLLTALHRWLIGHSLIKLAKIGMINKLQLMFSVQSHRVIYGCKVTLQTADLLWRGLPLLRKLLQMCFLPGNCMCHCASVLLGKS